MPIYSNWKLHWPTIVQSSSTCDAWLAYRTTHFPRVNDQAELMHATILYLSDDMFVNAIFAALSSSKW